MNVQVLYAPEYGIPQIRKRAFFVGLLHSDDKFKYPDPILKEENFMALSQQMVDF